MAQMLIRKNVNVQAKEKRAIRVFEGPSAPLDYMVNPANEVFPE